MENHAEKIEIRICQGTACFVLGAAELLIAVEEIPETWKTRCDISGAPCLGYCGERAEDKRMPFVTIGGVPHHDVTPEKLLRLLGEALGEIPAGGDSDRGDAPLGRTAS